MTYLLSWRICYDGIFNACCFTNPIINFVQWSWMRVLLMVAWLFMEVLLIMLCYWGCGCILAPPISALFSRNSHFIILMLLLVARIALAIRSFCFGFQGSPAVSLFGVTEQYHACSNFKFWLWLISMCVAVWLHPIFLYNNNNIIAYYTVYFISNKDSKWSSLKYCYRLCMSWSSPVHAVSTILLFVQQSWTLVLLMVAWLFTKVLLQRKGANICDKNFSVECVTSCQEDQSCVQWWSKADWSTSIFHAMADWISESSFS